MKYSTDTMPDAAALQGQGGVLAWIVTALRGVTRPQNRSLRCLEALQLGPKRTVYLLECEGKRFLAGAGGDGINTLLPLNEQFRCAAQANEESS